MSVHPLVSRNPHAACDSGSPCDICKRKYAPAEQEARDRHPVGKALPWYRIDWADMEVVLDVDRLTYQDVVELYAAMTNPTPCDRDGCYEPAEDGGLCVAHRDAADALPVGGWRK